MFSSVFIRLDDFGSYGLAGSHCDPNNRSINTRIKYMFISSQGYFVSCVRTPVMDDIAVLLLCSWESVQLLRHMQLAG